MSASLTAQPRLRLALGITALISLATLGTAIASERWGGLVPCAMCLIERWPWRVAIVVAAAGVVAPRPAAHVLGWLTVLALAAGVVAGAVHVGVEWHLWPSPFPECMAPTFHGGTIAQRLASMPLKPSKSCEDATYLIPHLPISMAMMNLLDSLIVAVGLGWFLLRHRRASA